LKEKKVYMKKNLKKEMKLKDGMSFPKGTSMEIKVNESNPMIAILTSEAGKEVKVRSAKLHRYFNGFVSPSEEMMDPDFDSCIVPSLTGENIEPDGWDEKGFPSILLALGMI
jgi:hypothetical protein